MQEPMEPDRVGAKPALHPPLSAQSRPHKLPLPKSALDCFTGRYMYDVYKAWRQEAHRQHVIALEKEG